MFSAVRKKVQYGVSNYEGKMDEMGSTINQLLIKYRAGGINMPYTVEDYREELKRNVLNNLTVKERIEGLPIEDLLKWFPTEEIEAFLKKSKKKKTRHKKS